MAGEHGHKTSSWIVVGLISVACVVLAFAFIMQSIPLAILGFVIGVAGAILGGVTRIMDDAY